MTFRLLLTSVGGAMSPFTIQCLRGSSAHAIEVVGVDRDPAALGRHFATAFEVVPDGTDPAYVDALLAIVRSRKIDMILPCSDEETLALVARRADIEQCGALLAAPPTAAIGVMSDKVETLRLLDRIGVPAPEWRLVESKAELSQAMAELGARHASLAVKPTRSRGSRDVYVIERSRTGEYRPAGHRECYLDAPSFAALGLVPTPQAPLLVMQGLVAPAHDTDVLCRQGAVLNVVPRQRINPAGVPFRGGILRDDPRLVDYAERIAAALQADWLFDIDTMSDAGGMPRVIEINCRPSGSLSAAAAAGVPILDDLISLAKGLPVQRSRIIDGRTVVPYSTIAVIDGDPA